MEKGDQVWWINGAGDRLTGVMLGPTYGRFRAHVWCYERNRLMHPRVLHLHDTREAGDHESPETSD